jgi:flagellar hook-associated protein FlgK
MTDLVSVASNAVSAYQRSLGTISNNIANVATEGYSRQEVVLVANPVAKVGNTYLGTGVTVDRIQRQYDTFVESNLRNSNSDLLSQEPMVNYANRVIDVMGGPSMGLSSALDQFFGSARNLSSDPASSVLRGSFLRDAENLATRFGQLSGQLDLVQQETDQLVESHVNEMNSMISQLAEINIQMTKQKSVTAQPPDLLDQRDKLLKDLSNYARINTFFQENGSVTVSLGPAITRDVVVDGTKFFRIGTSFAAASPEKVALVIDPYGDAKPLTSLTSGKLSGLMSFREQVLGSSRSSLNVLANAVVKEVNDLHQGGIDAYGNKGVALFTIDATNTAAAGTMQLVFSDPMRVATAAQFRVIESPNNISSADASVTYENTEFSGPKFLSSALVNNANASSGVNFQVGTVRKVAPVTTIQNGMSDVGIYLNNLGTDQHIQVFTRDGRQLLGAPLTSEDQSQIFSPTNGFEIGSTYSSQYLNQKGDLSYKDMSVFYGARADVQLIPQWDLQEKNPEKHTSLASVQAPAQLNGKRIGDLYQIQEGMFTLNGVSLSAWSNIEETPLQASDVKSWLESNISDNPSNLSGFKVTAQNEIRIPQNNIDLNDPSKSKYLSINGLTFSEVDQEWGDLQNLIQAINLESGLTHIEARQTDNGDILLTNTAGHEGEDIIIDSGAIPNAFGMSAGVYKGTISITRNLDPNVDTPIELGFGTGKPSDLSKLGFTTGAFVKGKTQEDLLVFVTGAGTANISATYSGTAIDAKESLRNQPLQIKFFTRKIGAAEESYFIITDLATKTEVAQRDFDPTQPELFINYQGLKISFSNPPTSGDTFTIDGNRDGIGNNENMLAIANLENKGVMGGGKTLGTAYIDHVNDMGNIARQAAISQSALKVVYDQAVSARDEVSGVSLDQEAADLIRFQQAYQAAAKILQVASQLFDSVLAVR